MVLVIAVMLGTLVFGAGMFYYGFKDARRRLDGRSTQKEVYTQGAVTLCLVAMAFGAAVFVALVLLNTLFLPSMGENLLPEIGIVGILMDWLLFSLTSYVFLGIPFFGGIFLAVKRETILGLHDS